MRTIAAPNALAKWQPDQTALWLAQHMALAARAWRESGKPKPIAADRIGFASGVQVCALSSRPTFVACKGMRPLTKRRFTQQAVAWLGAAGAVPMAWAAWSLRAMWPHWPWPT